jgi:hypothetical protein
MATYLQCFWGLFLSLSLYFIHSTPTPHVTLLLKALQLFFWSPSLIMISDDLYLFFYFFSVFPQVYIVYLGLNHIHDPTLTSKYHHQLLSNVFARFLYLYIPNDPTYYSLEFVKLLLLDY